MRVFPPYPSGEKQTDIPNHPLIVVSVMARKGGTGKSTITLNLATEAVKNGLKAGVLDLDPQATAETWADEREKSSEIDHSQPVVRGAKPSRFEMAIAEADASGYGILFIDTPANSTHAATDIVKHSDYVLIPTTPGAFDIEAINQTMRLAKEQQKPAAVLLNKCRHNAPVQTKLAAKKITEDHHFPIAGEVICNRKAFDDANEKGLGVQEHAPRSKAAEEIAGLYKWLMKDLGLETEQEAALTA